MKHLQLTPFKMKPPAAPPIPEPPKSHLELGPEDHDETAAEAWLTALEVVTKVEGKKAGGYHSWARHRAELTDGQLEGRMTKGKLPAGQPKACTVEHHVPIDEGFRPAAGADRRKGGKDELLPWDREQLEGVEELTRVRAQLKWSPATEERPARWFLVTHYPEVVGWDDAAKRYGPPEPTTPEIIDGPLHRGGKA